MKIQKNRVRKETFLEDATPSQKMEMSAFYQNEGVVLSKRNQPIKTGVVQKKIRAWDKKKYTAKDKVRERTESSVGGRLQKPIRYYRMWYRYLQLALEVQEKGFPVITRNWSSYSELKPENVGRGKQTNRIFIPREITKIKVNKKFYEDWDLDQVVSSTFDKWWKSHNELFEAPLPSLVTPKGLKDEKGAVFVRIDERLSVDELQSHIAKLLKSKLNQPNKFQIEGKTRYDRLLRSYNALVCTMLGKTPKEIVLSDEGYLRSPDVLHTTKKSGDKIKYSSTVSPLYKEGVFHLLEVSKGRFGKGAPR